MFILLAGIAWGCGSSGEAPKPPSTTEEFRKYESDFNPSEYNPAPGVIMPAEGEPTVPPIELRDSEPAPGTPELVQGYRVQIFAATSIDEASRQKEVAEGLFPEEWFYLVYDPPTYKIRAGNFLTRFEADRFARELAEKGFRDSWIVPDRVQKNAPPKPQIPEETPGE
jgi:hypothetical protein